VGDAADTLNRLIAYDASIERD